jgi:hypothetical protein
LRLGCALMAKSSIQLTRKSRTIRSNGQFISVYFQLS